MIRADKLRQWIIVPKLHEQGPNQVRVHVGEEIEVAMLGGLGYFQRALPSAVHSNDVLPVRQERFHDVGHLPLDEEVIDLLIRLWRTVI
ncbi:MAG: hypothetical protein P8J32_06485, partial [bacterium]|nr:hypothetical protein [bacterium]